MKKIRILYLVLLLLLSSGVCYAQTGDVYQDGAQFTFDDITFTVDRCATFVSLEYGASRWLDEYKWYYADSGQPLETDAEYDAVHYRLVDPYGHLRAMKEIFTAEEIAALSTEKYAPFHLHCAFDEAGVAQEIWVWINMFEPLMQVSPERYAHLIKLLKQRLRVIYAPNSAKVRFITLRVSVHFGNWDEILAKNPEPPKRP